MKVKRMLDSILSLCFEPTKDEPIHFNVNDDYNSKINKPKSLEGYGVYLILNNPEMEIGNILYIGMSGTYRKDEGIKGQNLKQRLKKKQYGVPRKVWIPSKMRGELDENDEKIDDIWIRCFITYDEDRGLKHLPSFVEASLLKEYIEVEGNLPPWNIEY